MATRQTEGKWLYVDYEKVNKVMMMILEKKYNVKIDAKVRLKEEITNEKKTR